MLAGLTCEPQVESKIMYRSYLHGQYLVGYEEVAQIGARIHAVNIRRTILLQLSLIHI